MGGDAPTTVQLITEAVIETPFDATNGRRDKRQYNIAIAVNALLEKGVIQNREGRIYVV
jgi:hypothetical protein